MNVQFAAFRKIIQFRRSRHLRERRDLLYILENTGVLGSEHRLRLQALAPVLHQALLSTWMQVSMAHQQKQRSQSNSLTDRQAEILRWIAHGKSNGEIAQILGLSEYTVKNHLKLVLQKLRATNRHQAAKVFANLCVSDALDQTTFKLV